MRARSISWWAASVLTVVVAPVSAPSGGTCDFQPSGLVEVPLSPCSASNLLHDLISDLHAQEAALRSIEHANELRRAGKVDHDSWVELVTRDAVTVDRIAQASVFGGVKLLTAPNLLPADVPEVAHGGQLDILLLNLTSTGLGLDTLGDGADPAEALELARRATNKAIEVNLELRRTYVELETPVGLACLASLGY